MLELNNSSDLLKQSFMEFPNHNVSLFFLINDNNTFRVFIKAFFATKINYIQD
jgi:hypothetical protein